MTKYEEKILKIINNSHEHLTPEQIFFKLKEEESRVVLATVYNNLNKLVDNKMISRLKIEGQSDRYDKMVKHDHLICSVCGCISDFSFEDFTKQLEKELGQHIEGYDLRVSYICDKCRQGIK